MDSLQQLRELLSEELTPLREQITNMQGQLSALDAKVETLDAKVETLDARVEALDGKVETLDTRMEVLDGRVENINVVLENDIRPSIQKIAEGHAGLVEKYHRVDEITDDIDEMKGSIVILEAAITKNSNNIVELQKAQA